MINEYQPIVLPTRSKHLIAFFFMLFGSVLVFGLVFVMNRMETGADSDLFKEVTQVAAVKNEAPKQTARIKKVAERPKPKPSRPMKSSAPIPQLSSGSSGLSFDLGLAGIDNGAGNTQANAGNNSQNNGDANGKDVADTPPQPKEKAPFIYPKEAKSKGITGYVVLSLLVEVNGQIDQVEVIESSPEGVFDDSAMIGIKNWRFSPGLNQGKPVKVWVKQKIRFDLG